MVICICDFGISCRIMYFSWINVTISFDDARNKANKCYTTWCFCSIYLDKLCNMNKSVMNKLIAMLTLMHIFLNMLLTCILLYIAYWNYPGGFAFQKLHQLETPFDRIHVHIDVASAQTGITRFGELYDTWKYNKTENIVSGSSDEVIFTHLLREATNEQNKEFLSYNFTHYILKTINSYTKIVINEQFPFFHVQLSPRIFILKKNNI